MFRKVDIEEFLLVYYGLIPLLAQKSTIPSGNNYYYWDAFGYVVANQCVLKVVHGVKDKYFINDLEVEKLVDQGILNLEWVDSDEVSS